jgi:hypothetical protein
VGKLLGLILDVDVFETKVPSPWAKRALYVSVGRYATEHTRLANSLNDNCAVTKVPFNMSRNLI